MRKIILTSILAILTSGCALFQGTARLVINGVSDQTPGLGTLSAHTLSTPIASNEIAFSPDAFKVVIIQVDILKGILNPEWQNVFANGAATNDIVQGVTLTTPGSETEITGGEYNGVRIIYKPQWMAEITLNSSDLNGLPVSDTLYAYTNNPVNLQATNYWATEELQQQLNDLGYTVSGGLDTLINPLDINGRLDQAVLNLIFGTENMIRVQTNGSAYASGPVFVAPTLSISVQ